MKILMLLPYFPYPLKSGGHIRSFNLIKNLSKKHTIILVSLIKDDSEKKYLDEVKKYCEEVYLCHRSKSPFTIKNIVKTIFGKLPFVMVRNFSKEAQNTISELLIKEKIDVIHVETAYMIPNIPETKVPVLFLEHTIEYQVYKQYVESKNIFFRPLMLDVFKLHYWEKEFWKKATKLVTVSDDDKNLILKQLPHLNVSVSPNAAGEDLMNVFEKTKHIKEPTVFLFQGNFLWLQNVEAAEVLAKKIFPELYKNIPEAACYIAGQKAKEVVGYLESEQVHVIDIAGDNIKTVQELYKESFALVCPMEGPGGTRLKILGAMAAGLPIISSKVGIAGLELKDHESAMIASTPQEYVEKAIELIKNPELYQKIRLNARKLIDEKYNWTKIADDLENIYNEIVK